jgi:hypothetical protein
MTGARAAATGAGSAPASATDGSHDALTDGAHCITCADEGVVMAVLEVDGASALCVDQRALAQVVAIDLVAPVAVGDELLVHAGVAIRALGAPA